MRLGLGQDDFEECELQDMTKADFEPESMDLDPGFDLMELFRRVNEITSQGARASQGGRVDDVEASCFALLDSMEAFPVTSCVPTARRVERLLSQLPKNSKSCPSNSINIAQRIKRVCVAWKAQLPAPAVSASDSDIMNEGHKATWKRKSNQSASGEGKDDHHVDYGELFQAEVNKRLKI